RRLSFARAVLVRLVAEPCANYAEFLYSQILPVNLKTFLTTWRGTRLENQYQRWAIAGLVFSNIVVGLAAFGRGETVVVIPPDLAGKIAISRSDGDRDYQQAWAFFLAQLLGNVTPGNADVVKKAVKPL